MPIVTTTSSKSTASYPIECVQTQTLDDDDTSTILEIQQQQNPQQSMSPKREPEGDYENDKRTMMALRASKSSASALRKILYGCQLLLIPFYFFGTTSPQNDFLFDVREYIVYRDIMGTYSFGSIIFIFILTHP